MNVHIYSQDTGVMLLALPFMDTSEGRRKVFLQPIYDTVCPEKSGALINWNALTGCDTTGDIYGKGKKGCFATFVKASPTILTALAGLGEGDESSEDVPRGLFRVSLLSFLSGLSPQRGSKDVQVFFVLATER